MPGLSESSSGNSTSLVFDFAISTADAYPVAVAATHKSLVSAEYSITAECVAAFGVGPCLRHEDRPITRLKPKDSNAGIGNRLPVRAATGPVDGDSFVVGGSRRNRGLGAA